MKDVYILGGHALALSHDESIRRGRLEGLVAFEHVFFVDDKVDAVAAKFCPDRLIAKSPSAFLNDYAEARAADAKNDLLIPDHTAPHVLLKVFMDLAASTLPHTRITLSPIRSSFTTPFLHKSQDDAIWAVSYATWTCPLACEEPGVCPHIQDKRSWDFDRSLARLISAEPAIANEKILFSCRQFVHAVACIPMGEIVAKMAAFAQRLRTRPPNSVLIATHSHCHGILGRFEIATERSMT